MQEKDLYYYSRFKVMLYLLFNLLLFTFAVSMSFFHPDFQALFVVAIVLCTLSCLSIIVTLLLNKPLAILTKEYIKIDNSPALKWKDVKKAHLVLDNRGLFPRHFIRLQVDNLEDYKLKFMQHITKSSKFGAFSIPLYAMDLEDRKRIQESIKNKIQE